MQIKAKTVTGKAEQTMKRDIKSMLIPELKEYFLSAGEKAFRAEQVFSWLHSSDERRGSAVSFTEMTNLPIKLREKLEADFTLSVPALARMQTSQADGTIKFLWRLQDGQAVESVVMEYEHGNTVCISSQAGCRMNCSFCASALGGLVRNLSASEMEDQITMSRHASGRHIGNVVLMGIGEPLDNYDNVIRFFELITHDSGMALSARRITLSTCGITENIDKLAECDIKLTLSISLHAPDDETRSRLMPVNRTVGIDRLFAVCGDYFRATGRRVSYEYVMINGVNDAPWQARLLSDRLRNTGSHLNLIPLNDVPERALTASTREHIREFTEILKENGVNFTIRRKLGADIDASCGQLRRSADS